MARRRSQILADGQEVDPGRAQVVHHLVDLTLLLPEPDHDPGLGEAARIPLLDPVEQAERVVVAGAGPDRPVEAGHGLEIVVVDVGSGIDDLCHRAFLAQEVGGQDLDRGRGRGFADRLDAAHELEGATVRQIIAVDRGDHDVPETELAERLGEMPGLVGVDRTRPPGLDVAEGAGPRAGIAKDHHRRVTLGPALPDVGAGRLLAHGMQALRPHQLPRVVIAGRGRRPDPDPGRLAALRWLVRNLNHTFSARPLTPSRHPPRPEIRRRGRWSSLI